MSEFSYGFRADKGLSYPKIEARARCIRRQLAPELGLTEEFPGLDVFHSLDDLCVFDARGRSVPLDYHVQDLPQSVAGLTKYDKEQQVIVVTLSTLTYQALVRNNPRALFSVGHEIGHAFVHTDQIIRMSEIPHSTAALQRGSWPSHPVYFDTEFQANNAAAGILMPLDGIAQIEQENDGVLDADDIMGCYGVSREAAERRIKRYRSSK